MPPLHATDVVPLELAAVTFPSFHPLAGQQGVVRAFAIRHPDGAILVDTGVGFGHADIDRWYQPRNVRIEDALDGAGIGLGDIAMVVNTHLHFDHCGQNEALGPRPIFVQSRERAAARGEGFTIAEWMSFAGANYVELDGDAEIAAGVSVKSTPGHTPGHQSVFVSTVDGLVIIAGQAIYSAAEYDHIRSTRALRDGDPPPAPGAYLESALGIIDADPWFVLFSHDESTIRRT